MISEQQLKEIEENNDNKSVLVRFGGGNYEIAGVEKFPHGKMIGIYDERPVSDHVDYLNPSSVDLVVVCCGNGGCGRCSGYGWHYL